MRLSAICLMAAIALGGCASAQITATPPVAAVTPTQTKVVSRPKDVVWDDTVAALGQRFFVVNNLEKASGLINLSYSGDPAQYVDCGTFTVTISGPRAKAQHINAASAHATYESVVLAPPYNMPQPIQVTRQMSLEGRVNLIFEAVSAKETRVTTATRYVLTRKISAGGGMPHIDNASFNGNEKGIFPPLGNSSPLECVATGQLERSILEVVK